MGRTSVRTEAWTAADTARGETVGSAATAHSRRCCFRSTLSQYNTQTNGSETIPQTFHLTVCYSKYMSRYAQFVQRKACFPLMSYIPLSNVSIFPWERSCQSPVLLRFCFFLHFIFPLNIQEHKRQINHLFMAKIQRSFPYSAKMYVGHNSSGLGYSHNDAIHFSQPYFEEQVISWFDSMICVQLDAVEAPGAAVLPAPEAPLRPDIRPTSACQCRDCWC